MNQTTIYSLLAAVPYEDARLSSKNFAPIPEDWVPLEPFNRSRSGPNATWLADGFSARVFVGPTGQIVIAYAGTEFRVGEAGFVNDFVSGNIPLASGFYGAQAFEAAKLYIEVRNAFGATADITFTGHSLGGGLAGLMGVLFDRPATVFAPAPFELSATDLSPALFSVRARLNDIGYSDVKLNDYRYFRDFASRESRVASYAIRGEILESIPAIVPRIEGNRTALLDGVYSALGGGDRHSIDLHAALLLSPSFLSLAESLPELLPVLFDKNQYGFEVLARAPSILMRLIRNEVGLFDRQGNLISAPNQLLTKFSTDVNQVVGVDSGMLDSPLRQALVAAAAERYYISESASASNFFSSYGNGIHFQLSGLGDQFSNLKSPRLLADLISENEAVEFGIPEAVQTALRAQAWHVHASNAAMTWTDAEGLNDAALGGGGADILDGGAGRDLLVGGAGGDNLKGGTGNDKLFGDSGDDTLDGGAGSDELYGGSGSDTYDLKLGELGDVIIDIDGNGKIIISGTQLIGGKKIADGYWVSADARWTYTLTSTGDLKITSANNVGDFINVRNWSTASGKLGIELAQSIETPTVIWNQITGDYAVATTIAGDNISRRSVNDETIIAVAAGTTRFTTDSTGNLRSGSGPVVTDNVLFGGIGRDKIYGLTGNDFIVGNDGDDEIYGGTGIDMIGGGRGADWLNDADFNTVGLFEYLRSAGQISNVFNNGTTNGIIVSSFFGEQRMSIDSIHQSFSKQPPINKTKQPSPSMKPSIFATACKR